MPLPAQHMTTKPPHIITKAPHIITKAPHIYKKPPHNESTTYIEEITTYNDESTACNDECTAYNVECIAYNVESTGPIDLFSVKEDTKAFFRRLRLKVYFHNQSYTYNKDIFEQVNPKKSSWSPPEGQFSSRDLFVRQCRHDIDRLNHSRRKRPSNLSTDELSAFKSLHSWNDIVIKPADKGGACYVLECYFIVRL